MNYKIEKNKLVKHIGNSDILELLKKAKCFIAGGAITSIFSGKEINDVDVYFRDYKSLEMVLHNLFNVDPELDDFTLTDMCPFSLVYTHQTKKSIMFTKDSLNIQLIYFKFFNDIQEIFSTFDFTVNMGAYDCSTEEFVLDDNFMRDISQRRLGVNPNTAFPIISLLRIDKYKEKGYTISRKDFVNLCLSVNRIDIKSWEDLGESIGGMYGYTYDKLFNVEKEFSIDEAIKQLSEIESNMENVVQTGGIDFNDLMTRIRTNLKISEPMLPGTFYKKVLRTDDPLVFKSNYRNSFKYPVNQSVNGGDSGIWAYRNTESARTHFVSGDKSTEAIIELKTNETVKIKRDGNKTFILVGDVVVVGEVK